MNKTTQINLRVSEADKKALVELAQSQVPSMTLSAYLLMRGLKLKEAE